MEEILERLEELCSSYDEQTIGAEELREELLSLIDDLDDLIEKQPQI